MRLVSLLLLVCALTLSTVAAYYSIIGLATIFSSAFWPVVVMAAILEISKLVLASWLYHNWHLTPTLLKSYLTGAVVVLMMITSLGIFGFLSKAHVDQNLITSEAQLRLELVNSQIQSVDVIRTRYEQQLAQLDRSIDIQLNANRAQGALAARRQQTTERNQIRQRLDQETARWAELNQEKTRLQQQVNVIASEVGPIRYVAQLFRGDEQVDLESAVTWMIVVIVAVFDPLAVLMIIAANMSLGRRPITSLTLEQEPSIHSESTSDSVPRMGQTQWCMESQTWQVYTEQGWQNIPMTHVTTETAPPPFPEEQMQAAMAHALDAWLQRSLSVQGTVDPNLIRDTVADTVKQTVQDMWKNMTNKDKEKFDHMHVGIAATGATKNI